MNVGSLFSGIGGIELGFKLEGFNTAWFVECEPYAQAVLRKHWPDVIIYDDVKSIDWRTVPPVDILTGGFPCQDISNAGKRAGIKGSRSSLWKYYCDAIRTIRPKYAVIENVAALAGRGLNVVLADLAAIGYDAEWHCVSASSVGALHQRERLFIVAYPNCNGTVVEGQNNTNEERNIPSFVQKREDIVVGSHCSSQGELRPGQWSTEPRLGRLADGISNRLHRIKCLGNAVVPQCAQVFAQAIKEREKMSKARGGK